MPQENDKHVSRRKFLLGAGALAAGAVATGGVLGAGKQVSAAAAEPVTILVNGAQVTGPLPARLEKNITLAPVRAVAESMEAEVAWEGPTRTVRINTGARQPVAAPPALPWPYQKLDPAVVRKRGYEGYFQGGCMYGAAAALLTTLQQEVGYPYTTIPADMFKYGSGGAAGWGTLCGALNGCGAILNLVAKDFSKLLGELFGWYTTFPFPSQEHEAYCKVPGQVQTVADSPLCHISVSKWCAAAGAKVNSDAKKDRCAKLTGDTAAHAVELLNMLADGKFVPAYKPAAEFEHCLGCHQGEKSMLDNEQGLMNCLSCHEAHAL